jgi:hypothetical protein
MDNYNGESLATLMHKLTKYQSLLAGTKDSRKSETYKYKIGQYTSKLSKLGVNSSSLNQMGGFDLSKVLGDKKAAVMATLAAKGTHDLSALDRKITELDTETTAAIGNKQKTLKEFTEFTGRALSDLDDLKDKISKMQGVDIAGQTTNMDRVAQKLRGMVDTDLGATIEKVIAGSLVEDAKKIAKLSVPTRSGEIAKVKSGLNAWGDLSGIAALARAATGLTTDETSVLTSLLT